MPDEVLSKAAIAFLGILGRLTAESPEDRVVTAVGDLAADVIPRIKNILNALYAAEPPLSLAPSVEQLGENASRWLRTTHPELTEEAVRQLANRFAFDWK
jgi:hypothetical protein